MRFCVGATNGKGSHNYMQYLGLVMWSNKISVDREMLRYVAGRMVGVFVGCE